MKKYILLNLALLLIPLVGLAHSGGEEISSFKTDIKISKNNIATITETIVYDFDTLERHGIRRFVPVVTRAGNSNNYYYYNFDFLGATYDGGKVAVNLSRDGNYQVIRLGDADKTISGSHTYTITYQMWPVVERDDVSAFLNWNLTGNYWEVMIEKAEAKLEFENGIQIKTGRCYSGPVGSTAQDCQVSSSANQMSVVATQPLFPNEGLSLVAALESGEFSTYLKPEAKKLPDWRGLIGFGVGLVALFYGLGKRLLKWVQHRYQLNQQVVVPQYEPPDKLSPAEIGLLNDNRADMTEITATLIDLAVRGYIKIEQTKTKGIFKKAEYTFHKLKDDHNLKDYEQALLRMLFVSGKKTVELKSILASSAAATITNIKQQLNKKLESLGYYVKPLKKAWGWKLGLSSGIVAVVGLLGLMSTRDGMDPAITINSTVAAGLGLLFGWLLNKRTQLSVAGYKQWAEVAGFKTFLTFTEKDRLRFHNAPAKNPKLFHKLLPYAIALGVAREWERQFAGMDLRQQTYYSGVHSTFHGGSFASSISSDFSSSISSSFTRSQSGSSSGGGSSGGGGGGGGGGSW